VLHFGIDKRACAEHAQEFGFSTILQFLDRVVDEHAEGAPADALIARVRSRDHFGFWQGLLRVVGSFGDCPRCLAVCPVGDDYHAHLADWQKVIPEKTPEKVTLAKARQDARRRGEPIAGLSDWNIRWVGPDGYQGIVARQLQDFKRRQRERAAAEQPDRPGS
jgi:hypothetical protein